MSKHTNSAACYIATRLTVKLWNRVREFRAPACNATYQSLPDYDVTPDGQRFLFLNNSEEGRPELSVVVNWPEELKQGSIAGKQ